MTQTRWNMKSGVVRRTLSWSSGGAVETIGIKYIYVV